MDLELKLKADVALVGFPNSGKSIAHLEDLRGETEDRRLPASPALEPHLGVVRFRRTTSSTSWPTIPRIDRGR